MVLQQPAHISINDRVSHHLTLQSFPIINENVIHKTKDDSANKIFESPLFWHFRIILSGRRILCFRMTDLYSPGSIFHKLVSYNWHQGTNFSQLFLGVDTIIVHTMQVPKKFLLAITRHNICFFWTAKFSAPVQVIGWYL